MKLINRSKQSPIGRRACDAALASHHEKFGDYGRQKHRTNYTVVVDGIKVTVEVVNRAISYVATAMIGVRRLRNLPVQTH
ncbi:DUF4060 family protein [Escherichia coli]|uniref:DUF4060 family protein n=1 Tax=Escherichia coli TaxID=562 RepID=UPI001E5D6A7A|nr:DUF4060 family protein [Escherichia coli]MCD9249061.1 DUF4060 family protein [Escherichia coli]